jgi:hypothetical protein
MALPTQKWRVVVAKLGASSALHDGEVDATNWMGALRAARQAMSERPSLPPGASCTVDAHGTATVLDPSSRRKFVLSPVTAATALPPEPSRPLAATPTPAPEPDRAKRFDTVALVSGKGVASPNAATPPPATPQPTKTAAELHSLEMKSRKNLAPAPHPAPPEVSSAPAPAAAGTKKRFATVAFVDKPPTEARSIIVAGTGAARAEPLPGPEPAPVASAVRAPSRAPVTLEPLLERDEEPTPSNPLSYRERAYLLPLGSSVSEAEASLRWKLAELQQTLQAAPRGKLVNLAVFDHRWHGAPTRPPVIVLQWRDWRDEVLVDYPAAARGPSVPPGPGGPHDDRLADVFEALEELHQLHSAAEGLDFAVRLLERTVPADATSACLYDINTDELRFVAVAGAGASSMQGRAVARTAGLFGQAVRDEHHASVFDITTEPGFDADSEGRPGLEPRNELLRPVTHEHQLLGMLQLLNRRGADTFTVHDISVVNYLAERLADFLHEARQRQRSHA